MGIKTEITPEMELDMIRDYDSWHSLEWVARKYHVNKMRLYPIFSVHGAETRHDGRRIPVCESVFDTITSESAYWIGFLMADGSICRDYLKVALATVDENQVHKFKLFLKSQHKVFSVAGGAAIQYSVKSKRLCNKLYEYGVTPRKSHTAKVCNGLSMNKHFWRGVVDGDGHISRTGTFFQYPHIGLTGSYPLCCQFLKYCRQIYPGIKSKVQRHGSVFRVRCTGKGAGEIIRSLYLGATVYLDRKMELASNIIS